MSHLLHASGVNYLQAQPRDPAPHTCVQNTSSIFHSAPARVAPYRTLSPSQQMLQLQQQPSPYSSFSSEAGYRARIAELEYQTSQAEQQNLQMQHRLFGEQRQPLPQPHLMHMAEMEVAPSFNSSSSFSSLSEMGSGGTYYTPHSHTGPMGERLEGQMPKKMMASVLSSTQSITGWPPHFPTASPIPMQAPPPVMTLHDSMDADARFRSIATMIHNMPPAGVAQKLHEILLPVVTAMVGNNAYDAHAIMPSLCALSTQTQMQMCADPFLARYHVMLAANARNADSYVASEASTNSNKSSSSASVTREEDAY